MRRSLVGLGFRLAALTAMATVFAGPVRAAPTDPYGVWVSVTAVDSVTLEQVTISTPGSPPATPPDIATSTFETSDEQGTGCIALPCGGHVFIGNATAKASLATGSVGVQDAGAVNAEAILVDTLTFNNLSSQPGPFDIGFTASVEGTIGGQDPGTGENFGGRVNFRFDVFSPAFADTLATVQYVSGGPEPIGTANQSGGEWPPGSLSPGGTTLTYAFTVDPTQYDSLSFSLYLDLLAFRGWADLLNTASIKLDVPDGVTYTSASGVFLTRATAVPLPATLPLFASGLAGLGWLSRRRKRMAEPLA